MKYKSTILALMLFVLAVTPAFAQDQGGGRRFRQGAQGGLMAAFRSDVQTDLQLTADQKTKLDALRTTLRGNRGGGNGGQRPTQEEMTARRAEQRKQLAAILNADQMTRLEEIQIQLASDMAVTNPDVQKSLALSTDQIAKITDLQTKYQEAQTSLREKARNGDIDRQQSRDLSEKNRKALTDELHKVLTAEQLEKLKNLGGKPFKADEESR